MVRFILLFCIILLSSACQGGEGRALVLHGDKTPTIVVTVPYAQSALDTTPAPTAIATRHPVDKLPSNALATFDPATAEPALDVHDRYYIKGDCVAYFCMITLWSTDPAQDNVRVWVRRTVLGLPAYIPPTQTPIPPTPIPYCAQINGFSVCGLLRDKDEIDAAAAQKYLNSLHSPPPVITPAIPSDQLCTACSP